MLSFLSALQENLSVLFSSVVPASAAATRGPELSCRSSTLNQAVWMGNTLRSTDSVPAHCQSNSRHEVWKQGWMFTKGRKKTEETKQTKSGRKNWERFLSTRNHHKAFLFSSFLWPAAPWKGLGDHCMSKNSLQQQGFDLLRFQQHDGSPAAERSTRKVALTSLLLLYLFAISLNNNCHYCNVAEMCMSCLNKFIKISSPNLITDRLNNVFLHKNKQKLRSKSQEFQCTVWEQVLCTAPLRLWSLGRNEMSFQKEKQPFEVLWNAAGMAEK